MRNVRSLLNLFTIAVMVAISFGVTTTTVKAKIACDYTCHIGGGGGGGGTGGTGNSGGRGNKDDDAGYRPPPKPCTQLSCMTPAQQRAWLANQNCGTTHPVVTINAYWKQSQGVCFDGSLTVDSCSGSLKKATGRPVACIENQRNEAEETPGQEMVDIDVCSTYAISPTSFTCNGMLDLSASVEFPAVPVHTRPYPSTLVRYDTVIRIGELSSASASDSIPYYSWYGNSDATDPAPGDWRFITLTVTVYPKRISGAQYFGEVELEHIGWIQLPIMQLYTFQWPLPSHPAGGGGPTAGEVGQLEELPQDMPLLENHARAPYGAKCVISWQEWEYDPLIQDFGWIGHSHEVEILPSDVPGLAPEETADLDGDGVGDAFWGNGVVVLRMNDANDVDDPVYAHSYSWGSVFYWANREGQGQISFP